MGEGRELSEIEQQILGLHKKLLESDEPYQYIICLENYLSGSEAYESEQVQEGLESTILGFYNTSFNSIAREKCLEKSSERRDAAGCLAFAMVFGGFAGTYYAANVNNPAILAASLCCQTMGLFLMLFSSVRYFAEKAEIKNSRISELLEEGQGLADFLGIDKYEDNGRKEFLRKIKGMKGVLLKSTDKYRKSDAD